MLFFSVIIKHFDLIVLKILLSIVFIIVMAFDISSYNRIFWTDPGSPPIEWVNKVLEYKRNNSYHPPSIEDSSNISGFVPDQFSSSFSDKLLTIPPQISSGPNPYVSYHSDAIGPSAIVNNVEVPPDNRNVYEGIEILGDDFVGLTDCRRCGKPRPRRAHHCSTCRRCILRMDHHCPWVGNCVGAQNHKFFLLFMIYTVIAGAFFCGSSVVVFPHVFGSKSSGEIDRMAMAVVAGACIVLALSLSALCMGVVHFNLIRNNATTLDVHVGEDGRQENYHYSLGSCMANCKAVLGLNVSQWWNPIASPRINPLGVSMLPQQHRFVSGMV